MLRESIKIAEQILPERTARLNELLTKQWKLSRESYALQSHKINVVIDPINTLYAQLSKLDASECDFDESVHKLIFDYSVKNKIPKIDSHDNKKAMRVLTDSFSKQLDLAVGTHKRKFLEVHSDSAIEVLMYKVIDPQAKDRLFGTTAQSSSSLLMVLRTGEFFTDVLSASDSKQLSKVIESYAMPPSSYKIKRNTRYSVDLDAYVVFMEELNR